MQMRQSYGDVYRNWIAAFCELPLRVSAPERNVPIFVTLGRGTGTAGAAFQGWHIQGTTNQQAPVRSKSEGIHESWRRDDAGHRGAESRRQSRNCSAAHGRS